MASEFLSLLGGITIYFISPNGNTNFRTSDILNNVPASDFQLQGGQGYLVQTNSAPQSVTFSGTTWSNMLANPPTNHPTSIPNYNGNPNF
jgi:hypothetical protein